MCTNALSKQGFIKAFSDQSESFVTGFAPLQNTMKSLFLRKVHLWPRLVGKEAWGSQCLSFAYWAANWCKNVLCLRFHVMVADDLESSNENIIELRQPMSEKMDKIQHSIVECMDACLSDIKRTNSMVWSACAQECTTAKELTNTSYDQIDMQDFTVENSMFKSFDVIVRRQLDPNWHRVSIKTKQLVGDLQLLRQLLTLVQYLSGTRWWLHGSYLLYIRYLAGYDCVTFYSFLQTIMASNTPVDGKLLTNQSPWLLMDAANTIFSVRQIKTVWAGNSSIDTKCYDRS